jgi:hypothetical protein
MGLFSRFCVLDAGNAVAGFVMPGLAGFAEASPAERTLGPA